MKVPIRSRWGVVIIIAAVIIIAVLLQAFGVLKFAENTTTAVLSPVQSVFSTTADRVKNFFVYFSDIKSLREENRTLKEEINELTNDKITLENKLNEVELIQEQIDYITRHEYRGISGKIIGRSTSESLQVVIINKGTHDGIQNGYPVIVGDGVLIGKIIEAQQYISKVMLLNDIRSEISATVQNDEKSPGIVVGEYGLSIKIELVPQNNTINENQIVVTSGLEQDIPPNIIIGYIDKIYKQESGLFQEAIIKPAALYKDADIISVILPTDV